MTKRVADVLVETLQAAGVKRCYGIVGDTLNRIAHAIHESDIEWVRMLHEEAGAFAASAEAQFTILGKISKRGNRYLCVLFVQAAWVVLIKPQSWERHGLKPWIEAAKKRLHRNVLAIALANKLARIAWSVLARGRSFEARPAMASAA